MIYFQPMKLKASLLIIFIATLVLTLNQFGVVNSVFAQGPVSGPVSKPITAPVSSPVFTPVPTIKPSTSPKPTIIPVPVVRTYYIRGQVNYRTLRSYRFWRWTYFYYTYEPASNVTISLVNKASNNTYKVRTDRWGFYSVKAVSANYLVNAMDNKGTNFQPQNLIVNLKGDRWAFFSGIINLPTRSIR